MHPSGSSDESHSPPNPVPPPPRNSYSSRRTGKVSSLPTPLCPPVIPPSAGSQLFSTALTNLNDDRVTTFFKVFSAGSQAYGRNLMEILNLLKMGTSDQIEHCKHPRLPRVFQRAKPTFRLMLNDRIQIEHQTGKDKFVIGRFLTVAGQPQPRGSVWVDSIEIIPAYFGELESYFLISNTERTPKKFSVKVDCPLRESLTWSWRVRRCWWTLLAKIIFH